jgi:hypothetical protein
MFDWFFNRTSTNEIAWCIMFEVIFTKHATKEETLIAQKPADA